MKKNEAESEEWEAGTGCGDFSRVVQRGIARRRMGACACAYEGRDHSRQREEESTWNNQGARRPVWVEQSEAESSRRLGQRRNRRPGCGGPFYSERQSKTLEVVRREWHDLT